MSPKKRRSLPRRILRFLVVLLGICIVALGIAYWRIREARRVSPSEFIATVVEFEAAGQSRGSLQPLGWSLAILGRDNDVRQMKLRNVPTEASDSSAMPPTLALNVVPWRQGIEEIAQKHQLIMFMEDHVVSEHREMIGTALPILRKAGFTHYAAEGLGESGASLARRGYPSLDTGYYTSDPRFANLLRAALDLKYEVHGYDFWPFSHDGREEYAANQLAKIFRKDASARLVVHAGHAHVLKYKPQWGENWLAARLWKKSGIEPFTIWQWSDIADAQDYDRIATEIESRGEFDEPVFLMPPPTQEDGLVDAPVGSGDSVDAILVHPRAPDRALTARRVLFPDAHDRINIQWMATEWPVVIGAFKKGDPEDAIALDQILLKSGERKSVLWPPANTEVEIRVFDAQGKIDSKTTWAAQSVSIHRAE